MEATTIGIDLAKSVFQIHGIDKVGKVVIRKKIRRAKLKEFMVNLPKCLVGMESCSGSNYWSREFEEMGHTVKLMAPKFVKPYVKSNKNDMNDAEAICEAVTRPNMRFVPRKSVEQQDIQSLHRVRQRLVKKRTALVNETRGLLHEYGIVIARNITNVRKQLPWIIEDGQSDLTALGREIFSDLYSELTDVDEKIGGYNQRIEKVYRQNEMCQRIGKINGIGPIISTAIVSACGDPGAFKNGRQFAAWLDLVPKQHSSGGKDKLLSISKRGNTYIRSLLVHGARSSMRRMVNKTDRISKWTLQLEERRGKNKACVALANKNARIIWALMMNESELEIA